jgi:TRAP-type C4-dicarboxylate transport system permease small subunit
MSRIVDGYFRLLRFFIAVCLAIMVLLVFGNVVLRYAFNSGITVSEELSRWLFVWLTFVGAVVALRNHAHIGMDSIVRRLPGWGKKACFVASNVLMLYCVYLFFRGSWSQTIINLDNEAPATGLSSGYFYYSVGVFFCMTAAALLLHDLWHAVSGRLVERDMIQVRESGEQPISGLLHQRDETRATSRVFRTGSDDRGPQ